MLLEAYLRSVDGVQDGDSRKRVYSRADFLRYNVMSIQSEGNKRLFRTTKKLNEQNGEEGQSSPEDQLLAVETWAKLEDYPHLVEANLDDQADLELLAWLVETFMSFVCGKQSSVMKKDRTRVRTVEFYDHLFDHMTLDDLVFMFIQVQNNINKWRMVWKAFQDKMVPAWRNHHEPEDCECNKKSLMGKEGYDRSLQLVNHINEKGYEYPQGSGIAGKDGRRRYKHLKEYFSDLFFDLHHADRDNVQANRNALIDAVKSYARTKGHVPETEAELDENSRLDKNRRAQEQTQDNSKIGRIADAEWDKLESAGLVFQA